MSRKLYIKLSQDNTYETDVYIKSASFWRMECYWSDPAEEKVGALIHFNKMCNILVAWV